MPSNKVEAQAKAKELITASEQAVKKAADLAKEYGFTIEVSDPCGYNTFTYHTLESAKELWDDWYGSDLELDEVPDKMRSAFGVTIPGWTSSSSFC